MRDLTFSLIGSILNPEERHYPEHPEDEYTQEIDPFDGGVIRPNGKDCVNMMVFFLISCRRLGITGGCYSSEQPLV